VKISPNGQYYATSSTDKTIKIHSLTTGKLITILQGHLKGISDIAWSPDSRYLASGSDDCTIRIWNVEFSECIKVLKGHTYFITSLSFNHKGNLLISGSADEAIRIWDVLSGKCLKTLSAHSDPIASLDLSWDDSIIVSASYDGLIRLFDTDSGQCLKTLIYDKFTTSSSFPVSCVKFTPNSRYLLATTLDNTIRLWDYMNNKVVKTYSGAVLEKYSCSLGFVRGEFVVSGDEKGSLIVWDLQTKKIVQKLEDDTIDKSGDNGSVLQIDVLDDVLISANFKGEVKVYDIER
jgi:COMPASS component SWD3